MSKKGNKGKTVVKSFKDIKEKNLKTQSIKKTQISPKTKEQNSTNAQDKNEQANKIMKIVGSAVILASTGYGYSVGLKAKKDNPKISAPAVAVIYGMLSLAGWVIGTSIGEVITNKIQERKKDEDIKKVA